MIIAYYHVNILSHRTLKLPTIKFVKFLKLEKSVTKNSQHSILWYDFTLGTIQILRNQKGGWPPNAYVVIF